MKDIKSLELSKDLHGLWTDPTDLISKQYNGCIIIEYCGWAWDVTKRRKHWYKIECFCGAPFYTNHTMLRYNSIKGCGCSRESSSKTHNRSNDKVYRNYHGMLNRCYNPKHDAYDNYGGRGIRVCDRWRMKVQGFYNFLEDMGEIPEGLSLDRIDVNGNYAPDNCRWATKTEQNYNQRKRKDNTSGVTGVRLEPRYNTWVASIRINKKIIHLGSYKTRYEAYLARIGGELLHYGVIKQPVFNTEEDFYKYIQGYVQSLSILLLEQ